VWKVSLIKWLWFGDDWSVKVRWQNQWTHGWKDFCAEIDVFDRLGEYESRMNSPRSEGKVKGFHERHINCGISSTV